MVCTSLLIAFTFISQGKEALVGESNTVVACFSHNSIAYLFELVYRKVQEFIHHGHEVGDVLVRHRLIPMCLRTAFPRPAWRPKIFYSSGEHIGLPEPFPGTSFYARLIDSALNRGFSFAPRALCTAASTMRRARRSLASTSGGLYTQLHQDDHDSQHAPFTHRGRP